MYVALIAVGIIALSLLIGVVLASLVARLSQTVTATQGSLEQEKVGFNPGLTYGHKILVKADPAIQLKQARQLAAKTAAHLPRGANQRIGRKGSENLQPASQAMEQDPLTAVRIAAFHGWRSVAAPARPAPSAARTPAAVKAAPPPVAVKPKTADDLLPGKDYPYIEITEAMSPADKRKAVIANAKAKAAAAKALKESGEMMAAAAADGAGAMVAAAAELPAVEMVAVTPSVGGEVDLVPGRDYPYIEITAAMSPDEVRKARIANSKARSAAAKERKAAGGAIAAAPPAPPASPAAPVAPTPAPVAAAAGVPRPQYIEITDNMPPDEVRKARIANSKLKSAYNKALKEAGIDPASVGE